MIDTNRKKNGRGSNQAIFVFLLSLIILSSLPLTDSIADAAEPQNDFNKLIGRWVRNDASYIIEIKSVDAAGKMEAGYYNPRPIYVSTAKATREKIGIKIFIELRDVGYPGSTYTLVYVPRHNVLAGFYYQANLRQNFEVLFTKME